MEDIELYDWDTFTTSKKTFVQYGDEYCENIYKKITGKNIIISQDIQKEQIHDELMDLKRKITPKKQIYAKDGHLLLLNLVMSQKDWEIITEQSISSLKWDNEIDKKFNGFKKWNNLKKNEDRFLSKLFYGARLDNIDEFGGKKYLTYMFLDLLFFLAENVYHKIFLKSDLHKLFSRIYKPLSINNEVELLASLEDKLKDYLDTKTIDSYRPKIQEKFGFECESTYFTFHKDFRLLEEKIRDIYIFNSKSASNLKNIFGDNSEGQKLVEDDNIIIGIGTIGSIDAINQLLLQKDIGKYSLILFGGQNALRDSYTSSYTDLYYKLINKKANFVCYYITEDQIRFSDERFKLLKKEYYNPFPISNYSGEIYTYILCNCLKKNNGFLCSIMW